METVIATRTNRIVDSMRDRTKKLIMPIHRQISEEEQAGKDVVISSSNNQLTYVVISTRCRSKRYE